MTIRPREPAATGSAGSAEPESPGAASADRWPAWYAFVTVWALPATTSRRLGHVSLVKAWFVHLVALLLTGVAVVLLIARSSYAVRVDNDPLGLTAVNMLMQIGLEQKDEFQREPWIATAAVVSSFIGAELVFVGAALIALPFGARNEPLRDSARHVLRRTWLHTAHLMVAVVVAGLIIEELSWAHRRWRQHVEARFERLHPPPVAPDRNDKAAMRDYNQLYWRHLHDRHNYVNSRLTPWYLAFQGEVSGHATALVAIWVIWAFFRSQCAGRAFRQQAEPMMCRCCGYNLTGLPSAARCPECGEQGASCSDDADLDGPAWQHRRSIGRWGAFWLTTCRALRTPTGHSRCLSLSRPAGDCLKFAALNVAACAVISAVGIGLMMYFAIPERYREREMITLAAPIIGYVTGAALFCISSLTASVAALRYRIRDGRNILAGTGQAAAYTSGFLVVWNCFALVLLALEIVWRDSFITLPFVTGVDENALMAGVWIVPNIAAAIWYVVLVFRASAGVRYACR